MVRMADLCARSEQCEGDIRQKLYRMGLMSGEVQEVIDRLLDQGFIDNARFARSFARDKCRFSGWGRNKIRVGLMAKRVSAPDIAQGLEAIEEEDYAAAAERVAAAKARSLDFSRESSRESQMKLYRHILSRGFESAVAAKLTRHFATLNRT